MQYTETPRAPEHQFPVDELAYIQANAIKRDREGSTPSATAPATLGADLKPMPTSGTATASVLTIA